MNDQAVRGLVAFPLVLGGLVLAGIGLFESHLAPPERLGMVGSAALLTPLLVTPLARRISDHRWLRRWGFAYAIIGLGLPVWLFLGALPLVACLPSGLLAIALSYRWAAPPPRQEVPQADQLVSPRQQLRLREESVRLVLCRH